MNTTKNNTAKTTVYFTYNHPAKTIVGSEANFKKSGIPGSAQYIALMECMAAHPNYTFDVIEGKKKQTYAGLNRELVKQYVAIKGTDELKEELEQMIIDKVAFSTIRSWFLESFKNIFVSVSKAEREIAQAKLTSRKAEVRRAVRVKMKKSEGAQNASVVRDMPTVSNFK